MNEESAVQATEEAAVPVSCAVDVVEARALIKYAIDQNVGGESQVVGNLNDILSGIGEKGPATREESAALVSAYRSLVKLTFPVTGKTIIHTNTITSRGKTRVIAFLTFLFLALALTDEIIEIFYGHDTHASDAGDGSYLYFLHAYFLDPLAPFFWGALGSCVFILKRLLDLAISQTFDHDRLKGWGTRIILGAVLGGIANDIFDLSSVESSGDIDTNATAFLIGLGVKVVYGVLEQLINTMSAKLNLGLSSKGKAGVERVNAFLTTELARTKKEEDPARFALITDLIDAANKKP